MTRSALVHKERIKVFTRTWWKPNPDWPDGLEPEPGEPHTIGYAADEREARQMCSEWNASHPPGKLGRKAEFTEAR